MGFFIEIFLSEQQLIAEKLTQLNKIKLSYETV